MNEIIIPVTYKLKNEEGKILSGDGEIRYPDGRNGAAFVLI